MFANACGELIDRQRRERETGLLGVDRHAVDGDLPYRAVTLDAFGWEEREDGVVKLLPTRLGAARWLLPLRHAASSLRCVRLAAHRFAASYRARGVGESCEAKRPFDGQ